MTLESLASVSDNFKSRLKNPFLGTYVFVWVIRNWIFLYSLFNFDKETSLDSKITFTKEYFQCYSFWEILENAGISIAIILFSYLFISITKPIQEFFYKILQPKLISLINKNYIVTKNQFEDVVSKLKDAQTENENLKNEILDLKQEIFNIRLSEGENRNIGSKASGTLSVISKEENIAEDFIKNGNDLEFKQITQDIKLRKPITLNSTALSMISFNLISKNSGRGTPGNGRIYAELTDLGKQVDEIINFKK